MRYSGWVAVLLAAAALVFSAAAGAQTARDRDGNGIPDGYVLPRDADGDGLTDIFERFTRTAAATADSDADGVSDGAEDPDGDGAANLFEQRLGTDPRRVDTDQDGVFDLDEDADRDGLSNGQELAGQTSPTDVGALRMTAARSARGGRTRVRLAPRSVRAAVSVCVTGRGSRHCRKPARRMMFTHRARGSVTVRMMAGSRVLGLIRLPAGVRRSGAFVM